jgi:sec-independent protein translocase protein TatA
MFEIVRSAIQFASLGGMEWVILIAIIIALFVGVKKIPELARSFGRASGEFEKAKIEMRTEIQRVKTGSNDEREKLESVATKLGIDHVDKNDEQLRKAIEEDLSKNKSSST